MRLETGQLVGGRYRLVARIGSGGMADVWSADDQILGRRVALKFLHERFAQDQQFVERFRREAQSAAGLQHPNVVGVHDRGESEGRHWIAMEYVEGASLKDLIRRGLDVGDAIEIIRQVLAGARFAHARGIVHRDLKPQNVLVDSEGRAMVADFGIARAGASEITQTGSVLGTAQYLSPEQAQGKEVNAPSDLYSIGVMLYEALTGGVPFDGDSAVAVALQQVSDQPRPPSEVNPRLTPALDAVVLRALAKDPANRFADADEFIRALDRAEADPSGAGLGDTAAYAAVAAAPLPPEEAEAAPAPERRPWMTRRRAILLGVLLLAGLALAAFALTRSEQVSVPSVIELSQTEATATLERRGFEVSPLTVQNCAARGTVIEQQPAAGSEADDGSTVTITVSLGLEVSVPSVTGQELADARETLAEEELLVSTRDRPSDSIGQGQVIRSDPGAGDLVECGSAVTLFVSTGPELIELPDLLGLQQSAARQQVSRLDLIPNISTRDADQPRGEVIGQDPGPGSTLEPGTVVRIIVSTGAGAAVVPDVEGQMEDSAIEALNDAGLSVDVVEEETDDRGDDGRVLEQEPGAGNRLRTGDTVTIVVGRFVEPPPDPPQTPGDAP